jgi:hypothetical protein
MLKKAMLSFQRNMLHSIIKVEVKCVGKQMVYTVTRKLLVSSVTVKSDYLARTYVPAPILITTQPKEHAVSLVTHGIFMADQDHSHLKCAVIQG